MRVYVCVSGGGGCSKFAFFVGVRCFQQVGYSSGHGWFLPNIRSWEYRCPVPVSNAGFYVTLETWRGSVRPLCLAIPLLLITAALSAKRLKAEGNRTASQEMPTMWPFVNASNCSIC